MTEATPQEGIRNARSAVGRIHDLLDRGITVELRKSPRGYFGVRIGHLYNGYSEHLCDALKRAETCMEEARGATEARGG